MRCCTKMHKLCNVTSVVKNDVRVKEGKEGDGSVSEQIVTYRGPSLIDFFPASLHIIPASATWTAKVNPELVEEMQHGQPHHEGHNTITMAPKRPAEDGEDTGPKAKKFRPGFKIGPDNLPDGTYRRKGALVQHDQTRE